MIWQRLGIAALSTLAGTGLAQEAPAARPVEVAKVERAPDQQILEMTGSVTARRQARLSARTGGLVMGLKVDAGDVVKAGDLLMQLDDELAELALERITAQRDQAALEVEEVRRLEEEVRQLAKSGAFSRSEAETRITNLKVKTSALSGSEVSWKEQKAVLDRHRLIAPFAGVISRKLAEEGEWVTTGTPVVELVETDSPRLDVQVPQEWVGRLKDGAKAEVRLDAYPDKPLQASVATMVPVKDPVARTFLVRVAMQDPQRLAAPGMSGKVRFTTTGAGQVTQVPRDAVIRFADGSAKVWVVTGNAGAPAVAQRSVRVGSSLRDMLEVVSGLEAGEQVVVRGNESLAEGMTVEIRPAADASPSDAR